MTGSRVRVGIIGMGQWGRRAHLPSFASLDDVEVGAIVSSRPAEVRSVAEEYGVSRIEPDPFDLLRDHNGLDAVVIATPEDTHRDIAVAAFAQGLHVLCEKPLALDVEQGVEMVSAAEESRKTARLGFLFRHSPVVSRMKQLIDEGFIGDMKLFESISVNAQFADPNKELHWKMQRSRANGGVFVEYGSHSIDLAIWFGGPITSVVAHGVTLIPSRPTSDGSQGTVDVDDASSWIATYESGAEALFRTGWASLPVGGGGMRVYGSRGSLAWQLDASTRRTESLIAATLDDPAPRTVFEFKPPHDPRTDDGPFPLGLLARYNNLLAQSFVDDIRAGTVTSPTFEDGLNAQRVLRAIRTSLDDRRWVDVETA